MIKIRRCSTFYHHYIFELIICVIYTYSKMSDMSNVLVMCTLPIYGRTTDKFIYHITRRLMFNHYDQNLSFKTETYYLRWNLVLVLLKSLNFVHTKFKSNKNIQLLTQHIIHLVSLFVVWNQEKVECRRFCRLERLFPLNNR